MIYGRQRKRSHGQSIRISKRNTSSKFAFKSPMLSQRQLRVENLDLEETFQDQHHYRRTDRLSGGERRNDSNVDGTDDILHI